MFLERYFIVVTGLRVPLMPYEPANYFPSIVEWSIFAAGLAGFALLITIAVKIFPMFAVWEMVEEREHEVALELAESILVDEDRNDHGEITDTEALAGSPAPGEGAP